MHPWAISGPPFLLSRVAVIVGQAVARDGRRRTDSTTPAEPPSTVDSTDGTDRTVEAAIAQLVQSEQPRGNHQGLLAPGDPASHHPIDRDVHQVTRRQPTKAQAYTSGCSTWWSTASPPTATSSSTSCRHDDHRGGPHRGLVAFRR
jgi:hypothetical protein